MRSPGERGRLIAFEGGEGSGKTTQARRFADAVGAVLTREPGGTSVGERIRAIVLDPAHSIEARTEALLMAAARAQHVHEVVEPALAAGRDVVTDRFIPSSLAYQGHGRGLDVGELEWLSRWATSGLEPDLVVLLAVPPETGMARVGSPRDRLEAGGADFHARVAEGFRSLAAADPARWVVVDGTGSPDEVGDRVLRAWETWRTGTA